MKFKDVQYMTADDKQNVYNAWKRFVSGKFQRKHLTKKLYNHLTLHCSFIAHYNIDGFYDFYFTDNYHNMLQFINQFVTGKSAEYGDMISWTADPNYKDINDAMMEIMQQHADDLTTHLANKEQERELKIAEAIAGKYGKKLVDKYMENFKDLQTVKIFTDEMCECGHEKSRHKDSLIVGDLAPGHGPCLLCNCGQFTWSAFIVDTLTLEE